jgi:hypothetical protein
MAQQPDKFTKKMQPFTLADIDPTDITAEDVAFFAAKDDGMDARTLEAASRILQAAESPIEVSGDEDDSFVTSLRALRDKLHILIPTKELATL